MEENNTGQSTSLESKVSEVMQQITNNQDVLKGIVNNLLPAYKKNKVLIDEVLKYAEDNLKASNLLREKQLTALSFYHLEQCAEGVTKTLFYMFDLEIPKIHNQIELIYKFKENINRKLGSDNTTVLLGSIDNVLDQFRKTGISQLARLNEQSLNEYLDNVEQLKLVLNIEDRDLDKILDETLRRFDRNKIAQFKAKLKNSKKDKLMQFASGLPIILIIGLITYPHESYTRYHTEEISPKDYNEGRVPIVRFYDKIYKYLEDYIRSRKEYLETREE